MEAWLKDIVTNLHFRMAGPMLLTNLVELWEYRDAVPQKTQTIAVDEIAFRSFYDRTAPALRSYLRMLSKDATLADDLLQESYYRFLRAGISGLNELQIKAYLYKTATSAMRDYWRAEKRERRRQIDSLPKSEPAVNPNLSHDVSRLFQRLNPNQQTLLWLAYVEGFQHREIAKTLNLKEKSVRVLLLRARRQLASMAIQEGLGPKEKS